MRPDASGRVCNPELWLAGSTSSRGTSSCNRASGISVTDMAARRIRYGLGALARKPTVPIQNECNRGMTFIPQRVFLRSSNRDNFAPARPRSPPTARRFRRLPRETPVDFRAVISDVSRPEISHRSRFRAALRLITGFRGSFLCVMLHMADRSNILENARL